MIIISRGYKPITPKRKEWKKFYKKDNNNLSITPASVSPLRGDKEGLYYEYFKKYPKF